MFIKWLWLFRFKWMSNLGSALRFFWKSNFRMLHKEFHNDTINAQHMEWQNPNYFLLGLLDLSKSTQFMPKLWFMCLDCLFALPTSDSWVCSFKLTNYAKKDLQVIQGSTSYKWGIWVSQNSPMDIDTLSLGSTYLNG